MRDPLARDSAIALAAFALALLAGFFVPRGPFDVAIFAIPAIWVCDVAIRLLQDL
jgi:uncharacterized membrane protein YjjB (DUF3815 family)